jgi:hypothetical protein
MTRPRSILNILTNPEKNFFLYFIFGVVLVTLITDGISALVWGSFTEYIYKTFNKQIEKWLIQSLLTLFLLLILYILIKSPLYNWLWSLLNRSISSRIMQVKPLDEKERFRGLIVAMGIPNNARPMTAAEKCIRHHWRNRLEYCWLICTDRTYSHAISLMKKLAAEGIGINFYYDKVYTANNGEEFSLHIPDDKVDNPLYTQNLIDCIYEDAQKTDKLEESDIIADLTGGLTSITVGITLACTPASRRLQYISQIDDQLKEIEISYQLKQDKRSR